MSLKPGVNLIQLDEVVLSVTVQGSGPLLFVTSPGWGPGSKYLSSAFSRLANHLTIAAIATRGSGGSSRPADPSHMGSEHMADDIEQLRRYLQLPSIDLFGHSNGGCIALSFAARYPSSCRRLIVCDSGLLGVSDEQAKQDILERFRRDPKGRWADALAYYEAGGAWSFDSDEAFVQHLLGYLGLYFAHPEHYLNKFVDSLGGPVTAWCAQHQWAVDKDKNATDELGKIRAQTLVILGRLDFICQVSISRQIQEGIADSELVVFEDCGHMPWLEAEGEFDKSIADFLIH